MNFSVWSVFLRPTHSHHPFSLRLAEACESERPGSYRPLLALIVRESWPRGRAWQRGMSWLLLYICHPLHRSIITGSPSHSLPHHCLGEFGYLHVAEAPLPQSRKWLLTRNGSDWLQVAGYWASEDGLFYLQLAMQDPFMCLFSKYRLRYTVSKDTA